MLFAHLVLGAWLCAAAPAAAQRAVVPVSSPGRGEALAPATPMLMPAPSAAPQPGASPLLASPGMAPAIMPASIAPVSIVRALVAPAPAALKLSAVSAAVAQFSAINLKSAPAAQARGAADDLMARALGAEIPEASVALAAPSAGETPLPPSSLPARTPSSASRLYLLSKPLHETVELGRTARFMHYALATGYNVVKAGLAWHATGSPAAGLAVLVVDLVTMPPVITIQSAVHLGLRYWWRKLSTLKRLADTPDVTRVRVLTSGKPEISGFIAWRQRNSGLVFVDAAGALPGDVAGFGAPMAVSDLSGRALRLVLVYDGVPDAVAWTPALSDLLSGSPLPARVAEAWRGRLNADVQSPLRNVFGFKKEKALHVEAHLSDGHGGETPLGTIVSGRSVQLLVGLGRWDRVKAMFGAAPVARSIPISDTAVERGGERQVTGVARRAWLRLNGGLIVR